MTDTLNITEQTVTEYEALAAQMAANPNYRVLKRVEDPQLADVASTFHEGRTVLILDVETTGLDPKVDQIIELAMLAVVLDAEGEVLTHFGPFDWREEPISALSEQVIALTGLTDFELVGQSLDERIIGELFNQASLVIAHNARFDASFVEHRFRNHIGMAWACSMAEIDWPGMGFDGRNLGYLLMQSGLFHTGHRAKADVWATFKLLQQKGPDQRTHFARLLEQSDQDTRRVEARHAPFRVKDVLKARGYRWDAHLGVWWIEIAVDDYAAEEAFLRAECACHPEVRKITARQRHR